MKDFDIEKIQKEYNDVVNNFVKLLKLEHFSLFEQNIILLYKIDFNTKEGLDKLNELCHSAILLYLYSDIELVILKNYLKETYNSEFDDDDVYKYVSTSSAKLTDQFKLEINHLNEDDTKRILYNLELMQELNDREVFNDILKGNDIEDWFKLNKISLYHAIINLQLKLKLLDMGLEEYVVTEVNELLKEDSIYEDIDIDDDFTYQKTYS